MKKYLSFLLSTVMLLSAIQLNNISVHAEENESWEFGFTGSVKEWTAPYTGKYHIEIFGAGSEGNADSRFNAGGHTYGNINLVAGEKLYIAVGQKGVLNGKATYNGGGKGGNGTTAGSGATSITTTDRGELKNFEDYQSEVVMVAGGSGGQGSNNPAMAVGPGGGVGFGISHSDEAIHWGHNSQGGCYQFGVGQDFCNVPESGHEEGGYGGPGGGGWYGGTYALCGNLPGGGGSGYISSILYDAITETSTHKGDGEASITYIGEVFTDLVIDLNGHGTYDGQTGKITINKKYGETVDIKEPEANDGYKFVGYKVSFGSIKPETGSYTYDFNDSYIIAQWTAPMTIETDVDISAFDNKGGMNFNIIQQDELDKVMTIKQSLNGTDFYDVFEGQESKEPSIYKTIFNYTGNTQTYNAPKDGLYKLEAYAPASMYIDGRGGYEREWGAGGGMAQGWVGLNSESPLYIAVGGAPDGRLGGWNGGGNGKTVPSQNNHISAGGCGATHIATTLINDGRLVHYENNQDEVLLCAGGGGGAANWGSPAGEGGGLVGGTGTAYTCGAEGFIDSGLRGGTQTSGYAFGQGQSAGNGYKSSEYHSGGGGGWYGGQAFTGAIAYWNYCTAGCGGSGHLGNVLNGSMEAGANKGAGYAVITLTQEYLSGNAITGIYTPDTAAPNAPSEGEYTSTNDVITVTWQDNGDNGTDYWHKICSYIKDEDSISGLGALLNEETVKDTITTGIKGFYYYIDNNSSGTATTSHTFTEDTQVQIPTSATVKYLHIAAIDGAGNISDTYTMEIPSVAKYTVNHYVQNEDGTYTLVKTEDKMGQIGSTVTPDIIPQTGRNNPKKQSIVVTADGKAHVDYYYDVIRFDINGIISWNDHENLYGTRPNDIGLTIYRDGEYFDYITIPVPDTVNKYQFPALQKYDLETGEEFVYTVKQDVAYSQAALENSEDKYTTIQNGYDFYNGIRNTERPVEPGYPDEPENPDDKGLFVEGDIYWDDNDDSLGFRPSETTITLYQKGEDGEWKVFGDPIVVDTKNENHYIFDWLPKYWYDENDVPTAYEYKVEENFEAWYVKDGEIKNAYIIHEDQPNDFDFTNEFIPDGPIIPVNEYVNTIIIKTNTDESVRIILKPLELFINNDYSVSYGNLTGNDISIMANKTGTTVSDLPGTRYEVVLDSTEYTLKDIKLTLSENMELENINGKWYVTIKNVTEDVIGTLEIELTKKEPFYQDRQRFMNYFAGKLNKLEGMEQIFSITMSDAVVSYDETENSNKSEELSGEIIKTTEDTELQQAQPTTDEESSIKVED